MRQRVDTFFFLRTGTGCIFLGDMKAGSVIGFSNSGVRINTGVYDTEFNFSSPSVVYSSL